MPPKPKFSKEEIVAAALELVSEKGMEALTARELGARLGSSAFFQADNKLKCMLPRNISIRWFIESSERKGAAMKVTFMPPKEPTGCAEPVL